MTAGPPATGWRRWSPWLLIGLVLAVVYSPTLDHPFHYDDLHSVVENPHIRNLGGVSALLDPASFSVDSERAMFRPLVVLSYVINYRLGGEDPAGYHLLNVLLHALAVAAVAWYAGVVGLGRQAWSAAALFAVHPLNVEVAAYVSARSESLATLMILLCLAAYVRSRQAAAGSWRWAAGAAMIGGLLAKATAITSVGVIALWEAGQRRRRWLPVLPFVLIALVYLVQTRLALGLAVGTPVRSLSTQWLTQLKAFAYYLYLSAAPAHLNVEHAFCEAEQADAVVVMAALLLVSLGLVIWRTGSSKARFAAAAAVVVLSPSALVPLNVLVNEHRLYPALALLLPIFWRGMPLSVSWDTSHRRGMAGGGFILLFLLGTMAVLSAQRVALWGSGLGLWQDAVAKAPGMFRNHLHLGGILEGQGELPAALHAYRRAAELAPGNEQAHYNLANVQRAMGDTVAARDSYLRSLAIAPGFMEAALNLASLHEDGGDPRAARAVLSDVIQRRGPDPELLRRRALTFRAEGDEAAAEADLRMALQLGPDRAETHFSLANLLFDTARFDEAIRHYRQALVVQPNHQGATYNLADLALRRGNPELARQVAEAALLVGPVQGKLYYLLAQAYDRQGRTAQARINYRRFLQAWQAPPALRELVEERIRFLDRQ